MQYNPLKPLRISLYYTSLIQHKPQKQETCGVFVYLNMISSSTIFQLSK